MDHLSPQGSGEGLAQEGHVFVIIWRPRRLTKATAFRGQVVKQMLSNLSLKKVACLESSGVFSSFHPFVRHRHAHCSPSPTYVLCGSPCPFAQVLIVASYQVFPLALPGFSSLHP